MRPQYVLMVLFLTAASMAMAQMKAGRHKIELADPVGDVQENEGKPGKDVVRVAVVSDGENLHLTAELKEKVSYYLNNQLAGPVIEMHFNVDNNVKTGGIAFWGTDKKGFEYQVDLVACIKYKDGGLACLGAVAGEIAGFCSSYKVRRYAQDKKMPETVNDVMASIQEDIAGKEVEVVIPYTEIGLKSGARIRIAIRESDGTFSDDSYFPEVFFIVK